MKRSLRLKVQPTARQTRTIMERVEHQLVSRGAVVKSEQSSSLRFRMPHIWKSPRLHWLIATTSGEVSVGAGGGGPWRVQYGLHFSALRLLCFAVTVALAVIGWTWTRERLFTVLLLFWALAFGVPYMAAWLRFQQILRAASSEVLGTRE